MKRSSFIPPRFRFFLMLGASWYSVNAAGTVILSNTQEPVKEPKGWKETEIKWTRSLTYWGLITTLTTSYQFVEDGATILRHIFALQAGQGKCRLVVQRRRSYSFEFDTFYAGDIQFKTYKDKGAFVSVNVEQGALNALVKANENTVYELPLASGAEPVRMDGVALRNTSYMEVLTDVSVSSTAHQLGPIIRTTQNESELGVSTVDRITMQALGIANLRDNHFFFQAKTDTTVVIDYDIRVTVGNASGSNLGVSEYVVQIFNSAASYELIRVNNTALIVGTHSAVGTKTITLVAGQKLAFVGGLLPFDQNGGASGTMIEQTFGASTLKISYETRVEVSTCQTNRYYQVIDKLFSALSGNTATVDAPFFSDPTISVESNRPYHTRLAPTEAVRQIPGAKFKLRLSDLFQDAAGRWAVGMGVTGNTVKIAPVAEFFQDEEIADLGEVSDLSIELANDLFFSELKIGMKVGDSDALNGRAEFISPQTWKMPVTGTNDTRDASSPFIGGQYTIEQIRADLTNKDTTSSRPDNNIVVLETESSLTSGKYNLYRPQIPPYQGFTSAKAGETSYNVTLRPKLDLLRNKPILAVNCFKAPGYLEFQSAEREGSLNVDLGNGPVFDRLPLAAFATGTPPFLPVLFRFSAAMPRNLYELMENKHNGYFSFWWEGEKHKGYVDEISQRVADHASMECSLLAHPSTDLTSFVR